MTVADVGFELPGLAEVTFVGLGGSSQLYRAWQTGPDRTVAVKVLNVHLVDDDDKAAFLASCRALGRLGTHPHIATLYGAGVVADGRPYVTMEYCRRGSLDELVRQHGPLPVQTAIGVGWEVASALATAHRLGVVHGDVRPANILLTDRGHIALADFAIPGLTDPSRRPHTEQHRADYVAPEILHGKAADARTDLYALGVTLFTLLTGAPPYHHPGAPLADQLLEIIEAPVPRIERADVPAQLRDLVAALMNKNPRRRPKDVQARLAMMRDLRAPDVGARPTGGPAAARAAAPPAPPASASPGAESHGRVPPSPRGLAPGVRRGGTPPNSVGRTVARHHAKGGMPGGRAVRGLLVRASLKMVLLVVLALSVIAAGVVLAMRPSDQAAGATTLTGASYTFDPVTYPSGLLVAQRWTLDADATTFTATLTAANPTAKPLRTSFVQVIPKSLAASASRDITFVPAPRILQDDPVVSYAVDLAPHAEQTFTYTVRTSGTGSLESRLARWAADLQGSPAPTGPKATPLKIAALSLRPATVPVLHPGDRVRFVLSGTDAANRPLAAVVLDSAAWASSKPDVATVDQSGSLHAMRAGRTDVTAQIGSVQVTVAVQVAKPPSGGQVARQVTVAPDGTTVITPTRTPGPTRPPVSSSAPGTSHAPPPGSSSTPPPSSSEPPTASTSAPPTSSAPPPPTSSSPAPPTSSSPAPPTSTSSSPPVSSSSQPPATSSHPATSSSSVPTGTSTPAGSSSPPAGVSTPAGGTGTPTG